MTKLYAPDAACREIQNADTGRTFTQDRSGAFHASDPRDVRALKAVGCFEQISFGSAVGRRCVDCGFLGFFEVCGRCGGRCEKEN